MIPHPANDSNRPFTRLAGPAALAFAIGAAAAFPLAATAGDVVVGGPLGQTWKGDSFNGNFNYYTCGCNGSITAITQDAEHVYIGDEWGLINQFDRDTGNLINIYSVSGPVTSLAMHNGEILAAHIDGTIDRVNPANGLTEGTFSSPIQIEAMYCDGDTLYVSGPATEVWAGDLSTGTFSYFACACSSSVHSMTKDDTHLYVGDETGLITGYNLVDGTPERFFGTGDWERITALTVEDGNLLAAELDGDIHRVDPQTAQVLGTVTSPIEVEAMLLLGETGPGYPLQLNVLNLVAGERASIVIEGGTPGEQAVLMWSFSGGSFVKNNGTWCVDFELDIPGNQVAQRIVTRGTFNGSGVISRNTFIPSNLSGRTLFLQSAERHTCPDTKMSNVFQAPVQ